MLGDKMALPAHAGRRAKRIALLNSKGGAGKSTIAMNLAAYYSARNLPTTIYDFDPQESSAAWLCERPDTSTPIGGVTAARKPDEGTTRTWQLRAPDDTRRIILDTPAGLAGEQLREIVRCVDSIVIPVVPSPLDSRATAQFIQDLLVEGKARDHKVRIAVVANRFRADSKPCPALGRFLKALRIPTAAVLSESSLYLQAAERGVGIHELPLGEARSEQRNWRPLVRWLEAAYAQRARPVGAERLRFAS